MLDQGEISTGWQTQRRLSNSCVMCANEALRRILHSSSAGDLVLYLPSSVLITLDKTECV